MINMLMKEIINQIDDVVLESEIEVLQTMSDVYDKAQLILENSDGTEDLVSSYTFFQEGEIMDQATGKGKDESAIKKIAAFLPRLIMAMVDFIKKKFSNKREKPSKVTYTKESFEKLAKDIKENGINSQWVKGLIAAGAATVTIGAGGAIIVKMKRHNKDNDGNNEDEIIINPPSGTDQPNDSKQPGDADQPNDSKQPPETEQTEEASVQVRDHRYKDYATVFEAFNKSMRANNTVTKFQEVGNLINNLINKIDDIGGREHILYNSDEERNTAFDEYSNILRQTGEVLNTLAVELTKTANANKEDESVIAALDKQCRGPLNNLMKKLQTLQRERTDLDNSLTALNNLFTNLARMQYKRNQQTTNISDKEKRIALILAKNEEPDEQSVGKEVYYSNASFNQTKSIDINTAGSYQSAPIVLFGDGAVYVAPSAYTVNGLPEILNSFFTISPDDGINHQQGGNRMIDADYEITSVVPAVLPSSPKNPDNSVKAKLYPNEIQKGSITLSKKR